MKSFPSLKSFKRLKSAFKSAIGRRSPERDESGRVIQTRAASPPQKSRIEAEREYADWEAESAIIQAREALIQQRLKEREVYLREYQDEITKIIENLNEYLSSFFGENVNVDIEAPNIKYIVGMILTSNRVRQNVTESVAERLAKSKPLLRAVANFIVNRATAGATGLRNQVTTLLPIIRNGLVNVGNFLLRLGMTTGTAAYDAISIAASSAIYHFSRHENDGRASSPQRGTQSIASRAYDSITTGLPLFYNALYNVLRRVSTLLLQCGSSVASVAAAGAMSAFDALCANFTPQQAVNQAVELDSACAICMTGVEDGPLGYIDRHRNGAPGHPDKIHASCLLACRNRCPICRQEGPEWNVNRPPGQGGGGLKKYRSKSKSKHNSKTRRLRKSRSKPRKSYKSRKPRCSSRRK